MVQIEETNVGIALVLARLGDEDMGHFSPQKSAKIKRAGYISQIYLFGDILTYRNIDIADSHIVPGSVKPMIASHLWDLQIIQKYAIRNRSIPGVFVG